MNKENIDEVLRKFAHKYKNYRFSDLDSVKKVWNHFSLKYAIDENERKNI